MTHRLPAPPPDRAPADPPPPREAPAREPFDPFAEEEAAWETEGDEELIDPDAWPDDPDEPVVADEERGLDIEALEPLDVPGDDGTEDDFAMPVEDRPLEDDLPDLDAPDDEELPVLPWSLTVKLDGRAVPATVDPSLSRTIWRSASPETLQQRVAIEVAGHTLRLPIDRAPLDGDGEEGVVLGRDVLAGRFLLRP